MDENKKALFEIGQLATPSQFGRLTDSEWSAFESLHKPLPLDYKQLLTTVGTGNFGDLILFSPASDDILFKLPDAEILARETIKLYDCCTDESSLRDEVVLGYIDNRRSLVKHNDTWSIYDWESGGRFDVGDNLPIFIYKAYLSLNQGGSFQDIAKTIWKLSSDGKTRVPFFTPYKKP